MTITPLRLSSPSSAQCVAIIASSIAPSAPFSQNGSISVGHPIGGTNTTTMYNVTNNNLSDVYVPMSIETKDLSSANRGQPDHVPEAIPYEATSGPKMGSEGSTETIDRPDGDRDNPNPRSRLFGNRIDVPGEKLDQNVGTRRRKLEKRQVGTSENATVPVPAGIDLLCESFEKMIYRLAKSGNNEYQNLAHCNTVRELLADIIDVRKKIDEQKFKEKCQLNIEELYKWTCTPSDRLCVDFLSLLSEFEKGYMKSEDETMLLGLGFELCRRLSKDVPIGSTPTECKPTTHKFYTGAVVVLSLLLTVVLGCTGYFGSRNGRKNGRRRQRCQTQDAVDFVELSAL